MITLWYALHRSYKWGKLSSMDMNYLHTPKKRLTNLKWFLRQNTQSRQKVFFCFRPRSSEMSCKIPYDHRDQMLGLCIFLLAGSAEQQRLWMRSATTSEHCLVKRKSPPAEEHGLSSYLPMHISPQAGRTEMDSWVSAFWFLLNKRARRDRPIAVIFQAPTQRNTSRLSKV